PWIVSPVYARCKSTCSSLTAGLRKALARSGLGASEYRVASFSFDPQETAAQLQTFRTHLDLPRTWLTLRAVDQADLARTLAALDFRTITTDDGEFQHPNLIAILTPDLRLAGYLFGVEFSPTEIADAVRRARTGAIVSRSRWPLFLVAAVGFGISSVVFLVLVMRRRRGSQQPEG
ncbi:MAG TPA: hypothetical protein VL403_02920, partial [Candidatus Kryptonia bacterium]|nr:hypothetical protein [Candidatus Kryptonia bacterium]